MAITLRIGSSSIRRGVDSGFQRTRQCNEETVPLTPKEVLAQIRQREVTTVDLRYMDFPGVWQHFSIPADALTEDTFEEGVPFDGSSVMGWPRSTRRTYSSSHSRKPP